LEITKRSGRSGRGRDFACPSDLPDLFVSILGFGSHEEEKRRRVG
jgi:hypothetical protein